MYVTRFNPLVSFWFRFILILFWLIPDSILLVNAGHRRTARAQHDIHLHIPHQVCNKYMPQVYYAEHHGMDHPITNRNCVKTNNYCILRSSTRCVHYWQLTNLLEYTERWKCAQDIHHYKLYCMCFTNNWVIAAWQFCNRFCWTFLLVESCGK